MDIKMRHGARGIAALLQIGLLLGAGQAVAAEYWLCAKAGAVPMPDGQNVPIWGYVQDDNANLADGCPALGSTTWTAAGPALTVTPADPTLTIHLRNDLTVPTSVVIPGQSMPQPSAVLPAAPIAPVKFTDPQGRQRVQSFTHEVTANGGMADYVWNDVRPGTYLYHSGTHPQVQVQMGLYGALTKNFAIAPNQAYDGVAYDNEKTLLFSEIDPAQHSAIASGAYGNVATPTACQDTNGAPLPMTSTLCYKPKYFLINGKPFQPGDQPLANMAQGQSTLLRLLNAGYRAYVPTLQGMYMRMVAEDGNRYQYRDALGVHPRDQYQYSTWLAALKTTDAIVVPAADGRYPFYDRRLNTVTGGSQDGGIFGILAVGAGTAAFDASITKSDGLASVVAGQPVTYTIVVSSPSAVTGATVTDTMPADLTGVTWTCSASAGSVCPASGAGSINAAVDLAAGGSATFVVHATVSAAATPGTLTNTATLTLPGAVTDPNLANNTATDTTAVVAAQADLSITKTDNLTEVIAGNPLQYLIVVGNAGPAPAVGATVTDPMPAGITGASWTCSASAGSSCGATGGSGDITAPVNLAVGGTATFTVNANVSVSATGSVSNTATVMAPAGLADPSLANNSATDTTTVLPPQADLGITKTDGLASVVAGGSVRYTIVASNAGPVPVTGATVSDAMPASLTNVAWTCVAAPGSVCPAAGTGSINAPVTLANGGSATFTVNAMVSAAAPQGIDALSNTATIAAPVGIGDPNLANNSATDTTTVLAGVADLSITKTDNATRVIAGGPLSYTIVVGNSGPSAVAGAPFSDVLPADLTNATWSCVAAAGSSCAVPSGTGSIATTVNLAVGGTATFTVNATVSPTAAPGVGTLSNTATIAVPAGISDPNTANNSATDTDSVATVVTYFTTAGNTAVPGVAGPYDDADIYAMYSDGSTVTYARVFDASTTGVPAAANVDAFRFLAADNIYLSFSNDTAVNLPGLTGVQDKDIVHWDGTVWTLHFDGSDVGLTNASEDVDAFAFLPDDSVLISTTGNVGVGGGLNGVSHDILRCAPGGFGAATACEPWSMYFDGSDIGLTTTNENLRYIRVTDGGNIVLKTAGTFAVTSGANSHAGSGSTVFSCNGPTTGTSTACAGFSTVLTLPTLPTGSIDAIDLP
jgi:uncharacterized repeat protein (TIGR01451 family)